MKTEQNRPTPVNISSLYGARDVHHVYAEILAAEAPLKAETPFRRHQPEEFVPESLGYIYAERDLLCIEHMAKLPVSRCVKTNQEADKIIQITLRSPLRPETWWGKCPRRLTIGLSDRQYTKYLLQISFAKFGVLVSLATFWYGIMADPLFCTLALAIFVISSLIHAVAPVWYKEASRKFTSVKGVSPEFLDRLNQTKAHHNPLPTYEIGQG